MGSEQGRLKAMQAITHVALLYCLLCCVRRAGGWSKHRGWRRTEKITALKLDTKAGREQGREKTEEAAFNYFV